MATNQSPSRAFAEYLAEQLGELGGVSTKRFFSGTALVIGDIQLGFVASDETLYLRLSPEDRAELEALGGEPFSYGRGSGKTTVTPGYFSVPADLLEDRSALTDWARRAYAHAQAVHKPKRKRN